MSGYNTDMALHGEQAVHGDKSQFVVFKIGEQRYCIDIMAVREVRVASAITFLPGAPEFVRGVINLRGIVVPVCDLSLRFGQGRTELSQAHAIIIVTIDGRLAGLLVDEVSDIVAASGSELAPIPEADASRRNPFFSGLINRTEGFLIIVAPARLMECSTVLEVTPAVAGQAVA